MLNKKLYFLAFLVSLLTLFVSCDKKMDAKLLVQKSIAAHGGSEKWESIAKIDYKKETLLYFPNGDFERKIVQKISHSFEPFSTLIESEKLGSISKSIYQSGKVQLFENNKEVFDSLQLNQALQSAKGALYVFWQPYKLLDSGTKLEYQGVKKLLDSLAVHVLKVSYPEGKQNDIWHYFFNTNTFKLQASQVNHDGKISLITNETTETQTGLSLNKTRKSFFLDSLGKIDYLRAAYDYQIEAVVKH